MTGPAAATLPDHIPADLVQDFGFDTYPGLTTNPPPAIDSLRDGRPIVYAPAGRRGRGTWVIKSYDYLTEAFQTPEIFSSYLYSGFSALLGESWPMLPLEVDPPAHRAYRLFLNKVFSPSLMNTLADGMSETIHGLIARVKPLGGCEFQEAVGRPMPTQVFLRHMGLPLEAADDFLAWENDLLHGTSLESRAASARNIKDYLVAALKDRAVAPRDDVLTYIATGEIDGRRLNDDEQLGMAFVLYGAGLDTVAAALGFTFKFLAENQEIQRHLRVDPELRKGAIEELVRANSMVVSGRTVTKDTVFHGVTMKKGDFVSLPTMFGNRDPDAFENATGIEFDRPNIMKHIGFGSGAHNCLGSHLARREIRIVIDAWLETMPQFRIKAGDAAATYGGSVFGVDYLPLEW